MFLLFHPFDMESQTLDPGPDINSRKIEVLDTLEPQAIYRGTNVNDPLEAPFVVRILRNGGAWCTGSLIHEKWVLTAAHCLVDVNSLSVVAGNKNVTPNGNEQIRSVKNKFSHPLVNYRPTRAVEFDAGLLELTDPFCLNEYVKTVKIANLLNTTQSDVNPGINVLVYGWGRTGFTNYSPFATTLQKTTFILKDVVSEIEYNNYNNYDCSDIEIPTNPQAYLVHREEPYGTGFLSGDSGGPWLISKNGELLVVGISSFTGDCTTSIHLADFATSVRELGNFANNVIQNNRNFISTLPSPNASNIININTTLYATAPLSVPPNVTINVNTNGKIFFQEGTSLSVPVGSRLNLFGQLDHFGCGSTWTGVSVQGNPNFSQFTTSGMLNAPQGTIVANPGSKINRAKIGVSLNGGAVGNFTGTTFENNIEGVTIYPYRNFNPSTLIENDNLSFFSNCNFYIKPTSLFNVNNAWAYGIKLKEVRGIKVSKCTFDGNPTNNTYGSQYQRIGIYNESGGLLCKENCGTPPCSSLVGSTFKNLDFGINLNGSGGSRFVNEIAHATFENNRFGVNNSLMNNSLIYFNKFKVPRSSTFNIVNIGIRFLGESSGWKCEQNEFQDQIVSGNYSQSNVGILCQDIGVSNNNIRNNKFTSLRLGNWSTGRNGITTGNSTTGLNYDCNKNFTVFQTDFYTDEIRTMQFTNTPSDPLSPCFNQFSLGPVLNLNDFRNYGPPVKYYYLNNSLIQNPNDVVGVVGIPKNFTNPSSACANSFNFNNPPISIDQDGTTKHNTIKSQINSVKGDASLSSEEKFEDISFLSSEVDKLIDEEVTYWKGDSLESNSQDSVLLWKSRAESFAYDLETCFQKIKNGESTIAEELFFDLPENHSNISANGEIFNFVSTFSFLLNRPNLVLSSTDSIFLEEVYLNSEDMRIRIMASELLGHFGKHIILIPELPELDEINEANIQNNFKINSISSTISEIYPNPSSGVVNFDLTHNEIENISKLVLYDNMGTVIKNYENIELKGSIDLGNYPPGFYILEFFSPIKSKQFKFIKN
jgi:hypothetical protein